MPQFQAAEVLIVKKLKFLDQIGLKNSFEIFLSKNEFIILAIIENFH